MLSRVALMFRVRTAKRLDLTDQLLFRRLAVILIFYTIYLLVWLLAAPTAIERRKTNTDLQYWQCEVTGWKYGILFGKIYYY